jgi:deoxyribonuclease-4
MFYFGAHVSKKAGIIGALKEVQSYGGNALQVFVSNPMSGRHKEKLLKKYKTLGPDIKAYLRDNNMKLFVHSPYTLNFAKRVVTPADAYWIQSYYNEVLISDYMGAEGCVIHVGNHMEHSEKDALDYMYISLKYIVRRVMEENLKVKVILETAAGQGTELLATKNNSFDQLVTFYARFSDREKKVLKLCIDTAHVFSAGYNIKKKLLLRALFEAFINDIVLIHLNDSKREYDSHVDRHERIGKGFIGKETLGDVVKLAKQHNIPVILETPSDGYKKEIPWIKYLTRD